MTQSTETFFKTVYANKNPYPNIRLQPVPPITSEQMMHLTFQIGGYRLPSVCAWPEMFTAVLEGKTSVVVNKELHEHCYDELKKGRYNVLRTKTATQIDWGQNGVEFNMNQMNKN